MKNRTFINTKFDDPIKKTIYFEYNREARAYQADYNRNNPGKHIWRHMLYPRSVRFFRNGKIVTVVIEIVRFICQDTKKTFSFYGTSILKYFCHAVCFIRHALSHPDSPDTDKIPLTTLRRWKHLFDGSLTSGRAGSLSLPGLSATTA